MFSNFIIWCNTIRPHYMEAHSQKSFILCDCMSMFWMKWDEFFLLVWLPVLYVEVMCTCMEIYWRSKDQTFSSDIYWQLCYYFYNIKSFNIVLMYFIIYAEIVTFNNSVSVFIFYFGSNVFSNWTMIIHLNIHACMCVCMKHKFTLKKLI